MPYPPGAIPGEPRGGGINITIPPPVEKGDEKAKFAAWVKKQGASAKQANDMWFWAGKYKIDPYYWASVIKNESNFSNKADSGQAYGFGQIAWSWVGKKVKWGPNDKEFVITREMVMDPGWNLRFSARLLADAISIHGYDRAYLDGYNPNDPNREKAWAKIQKTYGTSKRDFPSPSGGPGPAPSSAGGDITTSFNDPYVTGVNKKGKLTLTNEYSEKVLKWDGQPIKQSEFLRLKRSYEDIYVSYTGKRPSNAQIQQLLLKGWSTYKLTDLLSHSKSFQSSPLWKSKAPVYQEAAKNLLAPGQKVDPGLIRKAIVNNWSPDTLQAEMRKGKAYTESNEFKGMTATMSNVYSSIYGSPGTGGMGVIKEATLAGWTPDQFASWLRSRDEYVYTPEYRAKAVSLVEALGFMTGKVATLQAPGPAAIAPPSGNPVGFGPLPDDPRIKNGQLPGPLDTPPLVAGVQR